jgi:hypothetical protein
LNAEEDKNSALETTGENIRMKKDYELKKHKPWFNEGCSELLDQRKKATAVVTGSK